MKKTKEKKIKEEISHKCSQVKRRSLNSKCNLGLVIGQWYGFTQDKLSVFRFIFKLNTHNLFEFIYGR